MIPETPEVRPPRTYPANDNDNTKPVPAVKPFSATQPLLIKVSDACRLLGIGKTKAFALAKSGALERVRLNGCTRITMASVMKMAGQ